MKTLVWVSADTGSLLVIFVVARYRFNVDLLKLLSWVCREHGAQICFLLAFIINHQFCITVYHCAMDFTFEFDWRALENVTDGQV